MKILNGNNIKKGLFYLKTISICDLVCYMLLDNALM